MALLSLGIDSGSTTTKAALYDGENIIKTAILPTSANPRDSIEKLYSMLHSSEVAYTVTTGYGRALLPEADKQITEITCHARGAAFLNPNIQVVVDIGGQDCKVILLDNGLNVVDFIMNDKCAAGTGRFIEVMMRILEEDLQEIDNFVAKKTPIAISSMCTVFAESEIISLLANGVDRGDIAAGIVQTICRRTSFFAQKLNLTGSVFFSGGLAQFECFRSTLEGFLKAAVYTSPLAQFAGAIGAAVIGYRKCVIRDDGGFGMKGQ